MDICKVCNREADDTQDTLVRMQCCNAACGVNVYHHNCVVEIVKKSVTPQDRQRVFFITKFRHAILQRMMCPMDKCFGRIIDTELVAKKSKREPSHPLPKPINTPPSPPPKKKVKQQTGTSKPNPTTPTPKQQNQYQVKNQSFKQQKKQEKYQKQPKDKACGIQRLVVAKPPPPYDPWNPEPRTTVPALIPSTPPHQTPSTPSHLPPAPVPVPVSVPPPVLMHQLRSDVNPVPLVLNHISTVPAPYLPPMSAPKKYCPPTSQKVVPQPKFDMQSAIKDEELMDLVRILLGEPQPPHRPVSPFQLQMEMMVEALVSS